MRCRTWSAGSPEPAVASLVRARHHAHGRALDGDAVQRRPVVVGPIRAARRAESADDCRRRDRRRAKPLVGGGRDPGRRIARARDEPARDRRSCRRRNGPGPPLRERRSRPCSSIAPLVIWFDYLYSLYRDRIYTSGSTISLPFSGLGWKLSGVGRCGQPRDRAPSPGRVS